MPQAPLQAAASLFVFSYFLGDGSYSKWADRSSDSRQAECSLDQLGVVDEI